MVDQTYVEENPEEAKAEARERINAEAAARPTPTFMERLAELARELEPDMEGVCTADQLLSGIDTPRDLTFDEFLVFLRECMEDLASHVTVVNSKQRSFTAMGELRADRFYHWVLTLPEVEWKVIAGRISLVKYQLPLNAQKTKNFAAYAMAVKNYIGIS